MPLDQTQQNLIASEQDISTGAGMDHQNQEYIGPIVTTLPPVILAPKVYFLEPNYQAYAYASMASSGHVRYPPSPPPQQFYQVSPPMYDMNVHGFNRMNPCFSRAVNNYAGQIRSSPQPPAAQWPAVQLRQTLLHHQSTTAVANSQQPRVPRQKFVKLAEEISLREGGGETLDFYPTTRQRLSYTKSFDVDFEEDSLIDGPLYKWEPDTIMLHKTLMYWLHDVHYIGLL